MHFLSSWPNNGVVDVPLASYCSVIHVGVHSYILTTIFPLFPALHQRSEQTKIEYFCTGYPVKAINESVLRRPTRLDKSRTIIHA